MLEFAGVIEGGVRRYIAKALKDDSADIPTHCLSYPRGNF